MPDFCIFIPFLLAGMSHALKSDADTGHGRASVSSSTPEYLKEALGMKKPKHARSSSNGKLYNGVVDKSELFFFPS